MVLNGTVQLDLVPQGTFSERIRAGGAGIPAFFTPTGVGTVVAEGKEAREFDGRSYIMERALKADFAFVKAWKGDKWGNLIYRKTARNFNPMMATAAKITIAEVEHLVEPGELDPDMVHTPSVFVKRIFQGELFEKRIEKRTVRKASSVVVVSEKPSHDQSVRTTNDSRPKKTPCSRNQIQRRRQARTHRKAHRSRVARRILRQPRHRTAHADRQLRSRRAWTSSSKARTACSASDRIRSKARKTPT